MKERIEKNGKVYVRSHINLKLYASSCSQCDIDSDNIYCEEYAQCEGGYCYKLEQPTKKKKEQEMKEFKVGDKVRRIRVGFLGMEPGDIGTISKISKTVKGTERSIELKEYMGQHDPKNFELVQGVQEEQEKNTFTLEYKGKEYKVTPFNLLDIWDKKPQACSEFDREFRQLMVEYDTSDWRYNLSDKLDNESIFELPTLLRNIPWLIEKGFIQEVKEVKKETKLESGMVLVDGEGKELIFINPRKIIIGKGWGIEESEYDPYSDNYTLEDLNSRSIYTWRIKE